MYFCTEHINLFTSLLTKNLTSEDKRNKNKRRYDSILTYQLSGFNDNITATSFHHSSDNSAILKKIFDARTSFKKEQTCRTLLPDNAVKEFMLQLTSYNALHLG